MATNAKEDDATTKVDSPVTEEDLRQDFEKAEVEGDKSLDEIADNESQEESEEGKEDGQTDDQAEGDKPSFVKQVPSIAGETEAEYLKNLETAYQASTTEALRLKALSETDKGEDSEDTGPVDPRLLYLDRMLNKDIQETFETFKQDFPQVNDPVEYAKFTEEAKNLSEFYQSKKQILTAEELYPKVASILGWERDGTDSKERLGSALKERGSTSKTSSPTPTPTPKSKISEAEMQMNRLMYPNKTDAEIREELDPIHNSLKK